MINIRKNGDTTIIELTDVLGQKKTIQTLNDPLDYDIFIRRAKHRVACRAITPVAQPVADRAQAIVTTKTIAWGKVVEDILRVPDSRETILATFKKAGHDTSIPVHLRRSPLALLRGAIAWARDGLRNASNVNRPV